jgi:F0F1-type ATP synthase delta subunit
MKHSPQIYAKAFSEIVMRSPVKKADLVKSFLTLVKKNNDQYLLKKIYEQAEKNVREKTGKRKLVVEIARKAKGLDAAVRKIAKKSDIVEEKINPDLIAGIKITINDEMQFDGSMSRKIKKLFVK